MSAPFAEYALTAKPGWLEVSLALGSAQVLSPHELLVISRRPSDGIYVKADERLFALGWGGTRNHQIAVRENEWVLSHLGHHAPIWINGASWRGPDHVLASGDRIAPALGLVFTFSLRPELELLDEKLNALTWAASGDEQVLFDWVMEQTGFDAAATARACHHLLSRRP